MEAYLLCFATNKNSWWGFVERKNFDESIPSLHIFKSWHTFKCSLFVKDCLKMYSICILLLFALKLKSFLMFADYYVLLLLVLATRRSDLHKMQSSVYHAQLNCDFSKLCVLLNYCKQQKLHKIKVLWSIQVSIFTVFLCLYWKCSNHS